MRSNESRQRPPQFVTWATWIENAVDLPARLDDGAALAVRPTLLDRLERFGLAATGEPLLKLKQRGCDRCAGS